MAGNDERRRAPRINAKVPVKVIPSDGGAHYMQNTESVNVSERGLYFEMPSGIQPGNKVDLSFTMPPEVTGGLPMKVRCTARVIRVDLQSPDQTRVGVAAHIERFETVIGEV